MHVLRELTKLPGIVKGSAKENYGHFMAGSSLLPLAKHLVQETIDSFLKIQIPVHVKVPHLTAHLYEALMNSPSLVVPMAV